MRLGCRGAVDYDPCSFEYNGPYRATKKGLQVSWSNGFYGGLTVFPFDGRDHQRLQPGFLDRRQAFATAGTTIVEPAMPAVTHDWAGEGTLRHPFSRPA